MEKKPIYFTTSGNTVTYVYPDGSGFTLTGARGLRNQNSGNLRYGEPEKAKTEEEREKILDAAAKNARARGPWA